MENGILSDIMSFLNKNNKEDKMMSLYEIVEFVNYLKSDYEKNNQHLIKRMNKHLSKNLNFFNYEIKKINISDNIELVINHELKVIKVLISKEGDILTDIKNKEIFKNLIIDEIKILIGSLNQFRSALGLNIKTKVKDLNIVINNSCIEIFMFKSKNWITMGKAFSLKYDYFKSEYVYDIDAINLKRNLHGREDELFSNILINKNSLPNEFQLRFEAYFNEKLESEKSNVLNSFVNKIRKLMKKK